MFLVSRPDHICPARRQVYLSLGELLVNLLELRVKSILFCIRYIGVLDRGLAPTLGGGGGSADLKVV